MSNTGSPMAQYLRLPMGAIVACLIVLAIHCVCGSLVQEPVARHAVRSKFRALTRHSRPLLVIAGDSRAKCGIDPVQVGSHLGLPAMETVNVAVEGCGSWSVESAYREFEDAFAPSPVLVLNVSAFSVNDRSPFGTEDELLWSLSIRDRLRLAGPAATLGCVFLRERFLYDRFGVSARRPRVYARRGFEPYEATHSSHCVPGEWENEIESNGAAFFGAPVQGIRWRCMERSFEELISAGAQVVVTDLPYHPDLMRALRGTPREAVFREFGDALSALCARLGIPVLRYADTDLNPTQPSASFYDPTHLNRIGAAALSELLARDLSRLLQERRAALRPALTPLAAVKTPSVAAAPIVTPSAFNVH